MPEDVLTSLPKDAKILNSGGGTLKSLPSDVQIKETYTPKTSNPYFDDINQEQGMDGLNEAIQNVPDIDDTKKKLLKDLALKGTKKEDLKTAILTFQGQHPLQEGSDKYYYNDKGIPTPLKSDERPPQGFDVANDLHGTQEEANKKGLLASTGAHLYNGVLKGVLGLEGLANLPYALATGEDADWYKSAKNRVESSLFKTPEYETEDQFFDSKDMKEIGDLFDPNRYKFNANIAQGQALNGVESLVSFLVGTKGVGAASKLVGATAEGAALINEGGKAAEFLAGTSSAGQKAQAFQGSYAITYPDVDNYVSESGLEGREGKALSAAITVPVAALEMMFGTEGLFVKNAVAKNAKANLIKGLVDGIASNVDGTLSKEALADAFKATTAEAFKLNKSFAADVAQNIGEEAATEGLQEFTKQGLAKLYDHLSGQENFKKDPISAESFGEYWNSMLSGAAGAAGPSTAATIQKRNLEVQKKQNENIYNVVQKGDEAVNALKLNIDKAVKDGEITADQGANAILKVDSYNEYEKQTKGKTFKDEDKRRIFDLTFEKQNLESQIPTDYEAEKLNGIAQAEVEIKKKQAKHIQDEIEKIFLRQDVENTTTPTAKKTEEEVAKDIEKEKEAGVKVKSTKADFVSVDENGKYKTPEIVNKFPEYEKISKQDWNDKKLVPTRVKKYKLADYVDKLPNKSIEGVVQQDYKDKEIDTFNVTLPDGKSVRFASSMVRKPSEKELGGFRGNTYEENFTDKKNAIGSKVGITVKTLKDSGRKVMFVWNADKSSPKYGKHIGMVKEALKGNSNYSEADLDEMADLRMTDMGDGPIAEVETPQGTPEGPSKGINIELGYKPKQPKVVLTQPTRENIRTNYINEQIEKHQKEGNYHENYDKVFRDLYGKKFDRLNPNLNAEENTTPREELAAGNTEENNSENTGKSKTKKAGKTRIQQKVKDPNRIKAMMLDVYSPKAIIMQHFIGGGKISKEAIIDFYKGSTKEANLRSHMVALQSKYGKKYAPNFNELAHDLWESNKDLTPYADVQDYKNDLEETIQEYSSVVQMAKDLISTYTLEEQVPNEEIVSDMNIEAEKNDIVEEVDAIQDALESESDETVSKLADDQAAFDKWEEDNDIKYFEGDVPFQKIANKEGDFLSAISVLKKAMPKMNVIYDNNLDVAGYVYKDNIFINLENAGLDTPIHEYGHVLIDSLGYNSELVQEGIKQLKSSPLWAETKKRYKELNDEMLGKEVLAEAIGREGADIFEDVSKESKFKKWLDKIFTWFKEKLGLEKNIAKKLAKQLLRGEGTQEMTGSSTEVQKQKVKEQTKYLEGKSEDELVSLYNELINEGKESSKLFKSVKIQLAYKLFTTRKSEILNSEAANKFIEKIANRNDISKKDILFKTLSHMSEKVPELQKFSSMFEEAHFNSVKEANSLNKELEALGKEVIKEKNKQLGITDKIKGLFMSDNAKYFDYLENPKASEDFDEDSGESSYVSGYWTEEEAKAKGFSKAQINFLNFMRKLQKLRNEQYEQSGNQGNIDDILKVDKGTLEAFKDQGLMEAFSAYLGNSYALKSADIKFKDPKTGVQEVIPYGEVEQKLIDYGKQGLLEKINALRLLLSYNFKARRASSDKGGRYNLSPSGKLNNKFLKPRDKTRGYSKDFYKAAHDFIQDYSHTKHMSPLLPYIDSIETLNRNGFEEHSKKENVVKWIEEWKDSKLFKNEKAGKLGPEVDAGLRMLRALTSQLVMGFNIPAAGFNLALGLYNNWRAEASKDFAIGIKRFGNPANKKKLKGIIDNYQVVATEYDNDPQQTAGKLFDRAAFGLTRAAEYVIQGSMFAGLMTEQDWNSFDENGNIKEGLSDKEKKELEKRLIKYKNRVSDIQGKYSEKDRRNYMNTEFGKAAGQMKTWVPDWIRERFGEGYIDADNNYKVGSYKQFWDDGFKQIRNQIKDGSIWKDKNSMSNLKAALTVAALYSLRLAGDDDERKRRSGDMLTQAMNNVLFIFDPQTLKYTIERPMASIGTLTKFVDVLQYAITMDEYKKGTRFGDKGDLKIWEGLAKITPYSKLFINDIVMPRD